MSLDQILNVQITRETTVPSQAGFGTMLFMAEHTSFAGRVKLYSSVEEVSADFADGSTVLEAATVHFSQQPRPTQIAVGRKDAAESYTVALDAARAASDEWYALAIESAVKADLEEVAQWAEAQTVIFGGKSADAAILDDQDDTDVFSVLLAAAYARTLPIFHNDAANIYPISGWFGRVLPALPGSINWAYKTLSGVPVDSLTSAEKNAILGKNGNYYVRLNGVNVTYNGKVSEGDYVDVIRGVDWLKARIQERIFTQLVNQDKIPYTDQGVSIIVNEIEAQLQIGVDNGFLSNDPAPVVTAPLVADVPTADKGNRNLPDINFEATLAGAINNATIRGSVVL